MALTSYINRMARSKRRTAYLFPRIILSACNWQKREIHIDPDREEKATQREVAFQYFGKRLSDNRLGL